MSLTTATESQDVPESPTKHHCITPIQIQSSDSPIPSISSSSSGSSTKSVTYSVIVVPELAIPADAYPKQLNQPGGGKEHWCHLCIFHTSIAS